MLDFQIENSDVVQNIQKILISIERSNQTIEELKTIVPTLEQNLLFLNSIDDTEINFNAITRMSYFYVCIHNYQKAEFWLSKIENSVFNTDDTWRILKMLLVPILTTGDFDNTHNESTIIQKLHFNLDSLIQMPFVKTNNINIFGHTFWYAYYNHNPKLLLEKYVKLQMKIFPNISQKVLYDKNYHSQKRQKEKLEGIVKIKLGVISCSLEHDINIQDLGIHTSSISDSFYPTFLQFSKNKFDVYFIHLFRGNDFKISNNHIFIPEYHTEEQVLHTQKQLALLNFDILLYLEFHMKFKMNYLAFSKVAPIQICTHGHPITTGIPNHIMDYFFSWKAAEKDNAQNNYSEKLVLLPEEHIWEYYIPRNKNGFSLLTRKKWFHYDKNNIDFLPYSLREAQSYYNWYFCSQASFKLHHKFDQVLKGILEKDKKALIFLIINQKDLHNIHEELKNRFISKNIDIQRIIFLDKLPHHHLMAMYANSEIILDSWFFGGDTTTRESIETGTPIITLPHDYLGSRWTQAYYILLGLQELIINNFEEYIDKAVEIANNKKYRHELKIKILDSKQKLFYRTESIKMWEDSLLDVYQKHLF